MPLVRCVILVTVLSLAAACGVQKSSDVTAAAAGNGASTPAAPTEAGSSPTPRVKGDVNKLVDKSRYFHHEPTPSEIDATSFATIRGVDSKRLRDAFALGFNSAADDKLVGDVQVAVLPSTPGAFSPPSFPHPVVGPDPKLDGDTLVLITVPGTKYESTSIAPRGDVNKLMGLSS